MGNGQSSKSKEVMEIATKTVSNLTLKTTTTAGATNINTNNFTMKPALPILDSTGTKVLWVPPPFSCKNCNINIGQSVNSNQTVQLNASITNTKDLQTSLKKDLKQLLKSQPLL